jgi:hypothetical protein
MNIQSNSQDQPAIHSDVNTKGTRNISFFDLTIKTIVVHTVTYFIMGLLARCVPVYLPMWMVDSTLTGNWAAEIGYDRTQEFDHEKNLSSGFLDQGSPRGWRHWIDQISVCLQPKVATTKTRPKSNCTCAITK